MSPIRAVALAAVWRGHELLVNYFGDEGTGETFWRLPDGTLMRWTWDLRPRGFLKLMSPWIARMGRRNEQAIWTSLKRYLEATPAPPPRT